jgi:hypothetical protein
VQRAGANDEDALAGLRGLPGVEVEDAEDAAACGASGCRRTEDLVRGRVQEYGQRVLCSEHLAELIKREVLDE